jgi:hypothetical protein
VYVCDGRLRMESRMEWPRGILASAAARQGICGVEGVVARRRAKDRRAAGA